MLDNVLAVLPVGRCRAGALWHSGCAEGCCWHGAGCCAAWRRKLEVINKAEGEVLMPAVTLLL